MTTGSDIREAAMQSLDKVLKDIDFVHQKVNAHIEVGSINLRVVKIHDRENDIKKRCVMATATMKIMLENRIDVNSRVAEQA
jgi:hypothetical protein